MKPSILANVLLVASSLGCASTPTPPEVELLLDRAVLAADMHLERGEPMEAAQFLSVVSSLDEQFPALAPAYERLHSQSELGSRSELHSPSGDPSPAVRGLLEPSWLGVNRPARYPVDRHLAQRALLYIPDRIADLLDCVSLEFHLGPGVYSDVHLTRGVQLAGGGRAVGGLGTYSSRSILGFRGHSAAGISALTLGAQAQAGALASFSGVRTGTQGLVGLHQPTDAYYQTFADYWAVGTSLTTIVFGVSADLHPLQIADSLGGFFMLDLLSDDWGTSRALSLTRNEANLIREIVAVSRSQKTVDQYEEWSRAKRAPLATTATSREPVRAPEPESAATDAAVPAKAADIP